MFKIAVILLFSCITIFSIIGGFWVLSESIITDETKERILFCILGILVLVLTGVPIIACVEILKLIGG